MKIGSFLCGLREEIREKLELVQNLTYDGACNSAFVYEKYERARNQHGFRNSRTLVTKTNPVSNKRTYKTTTFKPQPKDKNVAPIKYVVCFKCHGYGHYKK